MKELFLSHSGRDTSWQRMGLCHYEANQMRQQTASSSPDMVLARWLWGQILTAASGDGVFSKWTDSQGYVGGHLFTLLLTGRTLCSSAFCHCYQIPGSLTCNKKGLLFRFIVLQARGQDYQAVLLCACGGAAHDCGMCMCGEAGPITLYDGLGSLNDLGTSHGALPLKGSATY